MTRKRLTVNLRERLLLKKRSRDKQLRNNFKDIPLRKWRYFLQNEKESLAVVDKAQLIRNLAEAGLKNIEIGFTYKH